MKHKTFLFLFLLILSLSIEAFSQGTQEKGWVRLSFSFPKDIPIYDIKVNTREASSTDQYIIATFTDGKNEVLLNSGTSRGFWSLNLSLTWSCFVNKDGKNQKVKLEKPKDKNDNYNYLNLAKHKIGPLRLKEIQKNFLAENVYVLIEKNGYYYLINNQYYLALSYFKKKAQEGDLNSMDIYADLLLKYGNDYERTQAFSWFKRAADNGIEHANVGLAKCYVEGIGVEKNITKAETLLLMSNMDDVDAKLVYANLLCDRGVDIKKTEELYIECANAGSAEAMRKLIGLYKRYTNEKNLNIIDLQLRLLELGDAKAFNDVWYHKIENYSSYHMIKPSNGSSEKVLKDFNSEKYYIKMDHYGEFSFNGASFLKTHFNKNNEYAILATFKSYFKKLTDKEMFIIYRPENDEFLLDMCGVDYNKMWAEIISLNSDNPNYGRKIIGKIYVELLLKNRVVPKLKIMVDKSTENKLEAIKDLIDYYKYIGSGKELLIYLKKGAELGDEYCAREYEKLF